MNVKSFNSDRVCTTYIRLNTSICKSCWRCINICPNNIIGKIDFLGHSHAIIKNADKCTGCLKCLNGCKINAITKKTEFGKGNQQLTKKATTNFLVHFGSLIVGLLMIASGLILQINYHLRHHLDSERFLSFDYHLWSDFHKISIVLFSVLISAHVLSHFKWYKVVLTKKLISKNTQVLYLTIIFLITGITGYIAWIIDLSDGLYSLRKLFIEIHDKIALILTIYIFLHIIKRINWHPKNINR